MKVAVCPLCDADGGRLVFKGPKFRLVHVQEAGFAAFYRDVWNDHAAEFTDQAAGDRVLCMEDVAQVEEGLRANLKPAKVNLAALGNLVPHLHWHVVARFTWDSHFPGPVWAPAQRESAPDRLAAIEALLPALEENLIAKLARVV